MYHYLEGENTIFFDVDNTLIMWDPDPNDPRIVKLPSLKTTTVYSESSGQYVEIHETVNVVPHKHHLDMVKRHKQLGNTVIVWSKSGPQWAQNVVEFFGLTDYVDLVCGKPSCYYDDLKAEEFMVDRRYSQN